ncbi:hypothetical protein DPMN_027249 [Dreissena polymorpha]|uniref:Uncharacterized protein n=1 Tax=Dreissena polymorpha TaxID=45954 RepID=A0A9D4LT49_DREPO|nr:hypothetical protein DPMN_026996 [Dreissena polymorpha]KAH3864233.1 hypothetical protein DPMN_027249 [Dreissena polymorpha]
MLRSKSLLGGISRNVLPIFQEEMSGKNAAISTLESLSNCDTYRTIGGAWYFQPISNRPCTDQNVTLCINPLQLQQAGTNNSLRGTRENFIDVPYQESGEGQSISTFPLRCFVRTLR